MILMRIKQLILCSCVFLGEMASEPSKSLKGSGEDSLAPNRAAARHRPAGLSLGTRLTGAVAAPGLRPPRGYLKQV